MKLNPDQTTQLKTLLALNQEISERMPQWNQGMGGNISVKFPDGIMAIKPSGLRLDELKKADDFAYLNFQDFDSFLSHLTMSAKNLSEKEFAYSQEIDKSKRKEFTDRRASMEAGFHAALPAPYVLHIHHLNSVVFVDLLAEAEKSDFYAKWKDYFQVVPYKRPGWELSEYFVKNQTTRSLILMKNHGAILQIEDKSEFAQFLEFDRELSQWLSEHLGKSWTTAQKTLKAASSKMTAPFKYFYPDVAIFEAKLKKFLKSAEGGEFNLPKAVKDLPLDLKENWQAMLYLHQLRPQMVGLAAADADSLRAMPSEMARVAQAIELAKATAAQGKKK